MLPITEEKNVPGKAEYFDKRESVCCGGKIVHWFGRVMLSLDGRTLPSKEHCLMCGQQCETRFNAEYRETQSENGDQNPPTKQTEV